jgi:hypothetical protein
MADVGSFDSLNPVLYKGEAAGGLGLIYETLMSDSLEEPSTSYGHRTDESRPAATPVFRTSVVPTHWRLRLLTPDELLPCHKRPR